MKPFAVKAFRAQKLAWPTARINSLLSELSQNVFDWMLIEITERQGKKVIKCCFFRNLKT